MNIIVIEEQGVNVVVDQNETNAIVYVDQGAPGGAGVSVVGAQISATTGELFLSLSNSTTVNAGFVASRNFKVVLATSSTAGEYIFVHPSLSAGAYTIEIDGHSLIPDATLTNPDGFDWSVVGQVELTAPVLGGEQVVANFNATNVFDFHEMHNDMHSIQGGTVSEYYHLDLSQWGIVGSLSVNDDLLLFNGQTIGTGGSGGSVYVGTDPSSVVTLATIGTLYINEADGDPVYYPDFALAAHTHYTFATLDVTDRLVATKIGLRGTEPTYDIECIDDTGTSIQQRYTSGSNIAGNLFSHSYIATGEPSNDLHFSSHSPPITPILIGVATQGQTDFWNPNIHDHIYNRETIYVNNVLLIPVTDYTSDNNGNLIFVVPLNENDTVSYSFVEEAETSCEFKTFARSDASYSRFKLQNYNIGHLNGEINFELGTATAYFNMWSETYQIHPFGVFPFPINSSTTPLTISEDYYDLVNVDSRKKAVMWCGSPVTFSTAPLFSVYNHAALVFTVKPTLTEINNDVYIPNTVTIGNLNITGSVTGIPVSQNFTGTIYNYQELYTVVTISAPTTTTISLGDYAEIYYVLQTSCTLVQPELPADGYVKTYMLTVIPGTHTCVFATTSPALEFIGSGTAPVLGTMSNILPFKSDKYNNRWTMLPASKEV